MSRSRLLTQSGLLPCVELSSVWFFGLVLSGWGLCTRFMFTQFGRVLGQLTRVGHHSYLASVSQLLLKIMRRWLENSGRLDSVAVLLLSFFVLCITFLNLYTVKDHADGSKLVSPWACSLFHPHDDISQGSLAPINMRFLSCFPWQTSSSWSPKRSRNEWTTSGASWRGTWSCPTSWSCPLALGARTRGPHQQGAAGRPILRWKRPCPRLWSYRTRRTSWMS